MSPCRWRQGKAKPRKWSLLGAVLAVWEHYFLNNYVMYFVKRAQSMNNLCVLSQEDVGHLCSVIPAVEELLIHGVGNKDQKWESFGKAESSRWGLVMKAGSRCSALWPQAKGRLFSVSEIVGLTKNRWLFLLQGAFFNCSSLFSVPKWKTLGNQSDILFHEILDVQSILVEQRFSF